MDRSDAEGNCDQVAVTPGGDCGGSQEQDCSGARRERQDDQPPVRAAGRTAVPVGCTAGTSADSLLLLPEIRGGTDDAQVPAGWPGRPAHHRTLESLSGERVVGGVLGYRHVVRVRLDEACLRDRDKLCGFLHGGHVGSSDVAHGAAQAAYHLEHHILGRTLVGDHSLNRKSTRLNSSHVAISYAVFCLKKKTNV